MQDGRPDPISVDKVMNQRAKHINNFTSIAWVIILIFVIWLLLFYRPDIIPSDGQLIKEKANIGIHSGKSYSINLVDRKPVIYWNIGKSVFSISQKEEIERRSKDGEVFYVKIFLDNEFARLWEIQASDGKIIVSKLEFSNQYSSLQK